MKDDAELLHDYAENRSEAAFAELVRRHLPMVYAVALRQVEGDVHLAQDVAQKVFADLASKAAPLSGHPVVSGWLYRGTRYTAIDVMRRESRRRRHEQEAFSMQELERTSRSDFDQHGIHSALDDLIAELPERDRDAITLRFFEGRPFADIGRKLRLTENAARMKVERSLSRLQTLLAKRGIRSSAGAIAALLSGSGAAAPSGLATSIIATAMSGGAAVPTALAIFMSATKIQVGVLLAVLAAGGFYVAVYRDKPIAPLPSASPPSSPVAATPQSPPIDLEATLRELRRRFDQALAMDDKAAGDTELRAIAPQNYEQLMTWAESLEKTGKDRVQRIVILAWLEKDPKSAATWATDHEPTLLAMHPIADLMVATHDHALVEKAIAALPDPRDQRSLLRMLTADWAKTDPEAALQWAMGIPTGAIITTPDGSMELDGRRGAAVAPVLAVWAQTDPRAAYAWIRSSDGSDSDHNLELSALSQAWVKTKGVDDMILFISETPEQKELQYFYSEIARALAKDRPGEVLPWVLRAAPGDRLPIASNAADAIATTRPDLAVKLLFAATDDQKEIVRRLPKYLALWATKDPSAATEFVDSLSLSNDAFASLKKAVLPPAK